MALSKQEQEVCITKTGNMGEYLVYCTDPVYARRIIKTGNEPYKVDGIDGEDIAWYFKLPLECLLVRKVPKKREYTEEQLKNLKERFKGRK